MNCSAGYRVTKACQKLSTPRCLLLGVNFLQSINTTGGVKRGRRWRQKFTALQLESTFGPADVYLPFAFAASLPNVVVGGGCQNR